MLSPEEQEDVELFNPAIGPNTKLSDNISAISPGSNLTCGTIGVLFVQSIIHN